MQAQYHHPLRIAPRALGYDGAYFPTIAPHIRDAKEVRTSVGHYTVVPRTVPNIRALSRLGFQAPSPIYDDYDWPGPWDPFVHQMHTAAFFTQHPRAFCWNTMGTGKTASAIWAWDYLRSVGEAGSLLVLSPLSTVKSVWEQELWRLLPGTSCTVAVGSKERREKLIAKGFDVIVMNHDGVKTCEHALLGQKNITHVVVDECTAFKNTKSGMWKSLNRVAQNRSLWMMSGTPCSQGPMDAFGMARLVCPERVPSSMTMFRDRVCVPIVSKAGPTFYKPRANGIAVAFDAMQPAIRYEKKDCLDMPPVVHIDRQVQPSQQQAKHVEALTKEWLTEMESGAIVTAQTAAVRLLKVLQVYQGSVILEGGGIEDLDVGDRFNQLTQLIDESTGKVLVFAQFTGVVRRLLTDLRKAGYKTERIDGSVNVDDRTDIIRRFQNGKDIEVLVMHPKAVAHGVTLTAATTTVWWGPIFSVETYLQANARMDRPGQVHDMVIAHLSGGPFENKAFSAVRSNLVSQQSLLDLYREATQGRLT